MHICFQSYPDYSINKGDTFETTGDFIIKNNAVVCRILSQNGIDHFAVNDDGCGIERGYILSEIYHREVQIDIEMQQPVFDEEGNLTGYVKVPAKQAVRFTADEQEYLLANYPDYFEMEEFDADESHFKMKEEFYSIDMETLRKIAGYLGVKSTDEKLDSKIDGVSDNLTDVEVAVVENYESTTDSLTDLELAICEIYEQLSGSEVDYTE